MEIRKSINRAKLTVATILLLMMSSFSNAGDDFCDSTLSTMFYEENVDLMTIYKNDEIVDCIKKKALFSLPTKVLYLLFGDVTLDVMDRMIINENITDEVSEYKESLKSGNNSLNIEVVFKAITVLMFTLASLVVTYQSLLMLYQSRTGDFLGKSTNTTWTVLKLGMGVTLLIPVEAFYDYSLAQVLVISAGVISSLLAGALWIVISILMNVIFLNNYEAFNGDADKDLSTQSISIFNEAVSIELCDIERRVIFLEKASIVSGNLTTEMHENNDFNKCLTSDEVVREEDFNENEDINLYPQIHRKTNFCISEIYSFDLNNKSCGGALGVVNSKENKDILEEISSKARVIASKLINLSCIDKNILEKYGRPYQYGYICAELSNGDFLFPNGKIKYVETDKDIQSYKMDIKKDIDDFMNYTGQVGSDKKNAIIQKAIVENSSDGLSGLKNGWFSASHYLMDISNNYREIHNFAREIWDGGFIQKISGNDDLLKELNINDPNHILKKYNNNIKDVDESIKELNGSLSEVSKIKEKLFSGFYSLNKFLGVKSNNIQDELQEEENCFTDFNKCGIVTANPLFEYVKMGNNMLEVSAYVILPLAAVDFLVDQRTNWYKDDEKYKAKLKAKKDQSRGIFAGLGFVLNLLLTIIKIYFIIALIIVYVTPLIPFLYFLSYIISWIVLLVEGVVTAQIWAFLHLTISKEEGLPGNVKGGYNLIFTIILQPLILILSMLLSMVATSVAIGIFNVLFGIILSILPIDGNPNSIVSFSFNVFAYTIYTVLLTLVILRITKIIFEIPNKASEMLALTQMGNGQDWAEVLGKLTAITHGKLLRMFRI
jgi:conjugal transfer/type IV secretion protein DotA/TraY